VGQSLGVAVAFSAGLFSFLSPCVLPLFPSYLSFITGMSVADLSAELSPAVRRRVLIHAIVFVLGAVSAAIQAIRLNYVEFFIKFFKGAGRAFRPFGERAKPEV